MSIHTQSTEAARAVRPASGTRPWREAALAGVGVTAVALLPLLIDTRFYFNDDYQSYFLPMFREIARLLASGEFPLATPKIWFGGAIAGEYQYAVFHPVCLALYLGLSGIGNLVAAAALYTLLHIFLLGAGLYALCRHLKCAPMPAFIGALIGSTSSWLLYWGASNWIPALVSQAWMVWALLFLLLTCESHKYAAAAVIATAFTLLAGWPFTNLAFLMATVTLAMVAVGARAQADSVWRAGTALLLGALLAMPAILTAAAYLAESGREADVAHLWSLTLNGLFSVGVPSAVELWNFTDNQYLPSTGVQMLYASWLVPVALTLGGWLPLWRAHRRTLAAVLALAALFALGSMLPGMGHFRWFFRLLPFYHAALAVLAALLLTHAAPAGRSRGRHLLAFAAVFIPFLIPTALDPRTYVLSTVFAAAIVVVFSIALVLRRHNESAFRFALIGGHVLVLVIVVAVWPRNLQVPLWDYPASGPEAGAVGRRDFPRRLALYDSSLQEEPGAAYWSMVALGNTSAYLHAESVNGYSPAVQRGIAQLFCFDFKGGVCAGDAVTRLFEPRRNGFNLLDLAGIEEVATDTPERARQFAELAGDTWRPAVREGSYTVFNRIDPVPGTLSALPPGGSAISEVRRSVRRAVFEVDTATDFQGGELIVRLPWYPGVYARLNGQPLQLDTIGRAMPVVRLEAGTSGRLAVGYWPKGLSSGLILAAFAALMLAAALRWPGRILAAPRPFAVFWRRIIALFARP